MFISIIIPTLNCQKLISLCLKSISIQGFKNYEIIIVDGGSTDKTLNECRKYDCEILEPGYKENQEARRFFGVKKAKGDYILFIDSDNILPDDNSLQKLINPFRNNDFDVVASFSKWYSYNNDANYIDKYFCLLGVNDPITYYLNKNDRLPLGQNKINFNYKKIINFNNYDLIFFDKKKLPVLGANGYLIKKKFIDAVLPNQADEFFHIDINFDILQHFKSDKLCFGFSNQKIIHQSNQSLMKILKKRVSYWDMHTNLLSKKRRYRVFNGKEFNDIIKLIFFIISAITIIMPTYHSIKSYVKTKNKLWFIHPIICFSFFLAYSLSILRKILKI